MRVTLQSSQGSLLDIKALSQYRSRGGDYWPFGDSSKIIGLKKTPPSLGAKELLQNPNHYALS